MQNRQVKPGRPAGSTTFEPLLAQAFGIVIRERRKKDGISQEALAHLSRIERSHMGKIERGEHLPSLPMVLRLAQVLNCKPGILVDLAAEMADAS